MRRIFLSALICVMLLVNSAQCEDFSSVMNRAKRGDTDAQFEVGRMYYEGDTVRQNYTKALEWFLKAAKKGNFDAQYNLGVMYSEGLGVKQDYKQAIAWLLKAAKSGDPEVQNYLGVMYKKTYQYEEAFKWFSKAAQKGNPEAQCNLGDEYYSNGLHDNEKRYFEQAFEWYLRAAKNGNSDAQNNLGVMYYGDGHGVVNQDYKKAFEWFSIAAENGNSAAQNNLGHMYEEGHWVARDLNKAINYYKQSAANGHVDARIALDRLSLSHNIYAKQDTPVLTNSKVTQNIANNSAKTTVPPNTSPPKKNITSHNNTVPTTRTNTNANSRPRMAIRAFADRTGEGKAAADAIMEMMVTELSKAKLFNLIEREKLDEYIGSEINLGQTGLIDPSTAPATGKVKGLQYTMTGSITLLYYSEKASGVVIPILGIATQAKTAYVVIDIRILDNTTAEIVYASEQTGEAKHIAKGAAVTDSRFFIGGYSKQTGGLLQEAARDAVRKHVSAIKKELDKLNLQDWS